MLGTKLNWVNGIYNTMVNSKPTKLPMAWSSIVPNSYKRIIGHLYQSK